MATTTVEIDNELLAKLRERSPGKADSELVRDLALVTIGFDTIRRAQERTAAAGVEQSEIEAEAVRAVHDVRRRRAAGQAAA
jgi:hypothetical protein